MAVAEEAIIAGRADILVVHAFCLGTEERALAECQIGKVGDTPVGVFVVCGDDLAVVARGRSKPVSTIADPSHPVAPGVPPPIEVALVEQIGQVNLAEIVEADGGSGALLRFGQGRQQQRRERCNDRDDDQQFDQRESPARGGNRPGLDG